MCSLAHNSSLLSQRWHPIESCLVVSCCSRPVCRLGLPCTPGVTVDDSLCFGIPPDAVETCNDFACTFQFVLGSWSTCDKSCGGGHRYRSYVCLDQFGRVAPSDSYCTPPTTTVALVEPCNTAPCQPARYEILQALSPCSASCMADYPSTPYPYLSAAVACLIDDVPSPLSACEWSYVCIRRQ